MRAALILFVLLAGCADTTPPWQLEQDRVIAVRATPPHVVAGERAVIDALVTSAGDRPAEVAPMAAFVADPADPASLAARVGFEDGQWIVEAADAAAIDEARGALGLAPGAPVPLRVAITFEVGDGPLAAIKTVYLGDAADNPVVGEVTVDDVVVGDAVVVPVGREVALRVELAEPERDAVDWFTSVGELSDIDDPIATLVADEPAEGAVVVVVRDERGGVAWRLWPASAR